MIPFKPTTHRKLFIDKKIRENTCPTATSLARDYAAEFGVTVDPRTIANDIADMRYKLNAPIHYDSEKKGYVYTDPAFNVDVLRSDAPALASLGLAGLASMGVIGGLTGTAPHSFFLLEWHRRLLSSIIEKLLPQAPKPKPLGDKVTIIHDKIDDANAASIEETIKDALVANHELIIEGDSGAVTLHPHHLLYRKNDTYLFGASEVDYVLLNLSGIRTVTETGATFLPLKYVHAQAADSQAFEILFSDDRTDTILVFVPAETSPDYTLLSKMEIYNRSYETQRSPTVS